MITETAAFVKVIDHARYSARCARFWNTGIEPPVCYHLYYPV
jgi:hypothetical protein